VPNAEIRLSDLPATTRIEETEAGIGERGLRGGEWALKENADEEKKRKGPGVLVKARREKKKVANGEYPRRSRNTHRGKKRAKLRQGGGPTEGGEGRVITPLK